MRRLELVLMLLGGDCNLDSDLRKNYRLPFWKPIADDVIEEPNSVPAMNINITINSSIFTP